ncbi:hypothetical protein HHI36_016300 [Cryptolaemus montrouzieri]|uniref:Protein NRDE2 homolog n=1 Tax=Cryptolaemus montrouzieri TaxID=559131 RepID=A0ABD2NJS8_9CUCU
MSVFPAYAQANESTEDKINEPWLQNTSFNIQPPIKEQTKSTFSDSDKDDERNISLPKVHLKSKKTHKKKRSSPENSTFFIDKKSTREFLTVKTISRPAVARYRVHYFDKIKKRFKFKRYFQKLIESDICLAEKNSDDKLLSNTFGTTNSGSFDSIKHETELSKTTAFYNKKTYDEPNNVEMWMKFIDFQDVIFKFEKTFKKGSIAKGLQVNAERKLDILEKALFHNPNSEELHRKRLEIMVSVFPVDELQKRLKSLLDKDDENIILWQGYIEATLCSMSHCNTSAVLKLYTNCLSTLHKLRRASISKSKMLEESILRMFYHCGLFLKQSGLFEQLWTLLKMYLEMNLGQMVQDSFDIPSNFKEKQLFELEEMVFKSQLPSHELWLRIEKLRESCHWLPVKEQCEDPQRIIFTSDVVELIQPITMPENTFKLTAIILTLLKIPLLPNRHITMEQLGLDYVPWALDSIETLLPIFFSIYPLNLELGNFCIDYQLAVGPQYLKVLPAQEEYLNFVLSVLQKCIDCSEGENKTALIVWWFRFQRLLIILDKKGKFGMPPNIKKNIKSNIKTLMKKSENRNNILFYVEYSMIEKEMNSTESGIKILQIALTFAKQNIETRKIDENQVGECHLIKTLVEATIEDSNTEKALKYLVNFVLNKPILSEINLDENIEMQASLKFKHVTLQLLSQELKKLLPVEHFLPIFLCDWIICNGWFIFLTKGPLECGKFLEEILEKLNDQNSERIVQKEILYEFYVVIMLKYTKSNPGYGLLKVLDDVLLRALQNYPTNSFFLSVLAEKQLLSNSLGPKWWSIKNLLLKTGHALPVVLMISITHQTIMNLHEQMMDTITGSKLSMENTATFKNAMRSLFREATGVNMCTRRCGLVWRLYLQFVQKYFDLKLCGEVYYRAVEECPWLKALYIDAAIYIPTELSRIQDLIIEKQLRIHITPEELDILRD